MKLKNSNPIGAPFKIAGNEFRWHESPTAHFRKVDFSDEVVSLNHTGWYVDTFQDGTTRGIVFQLPNNRGFIAGCTDPHNDGPCILELETIEDKRSAAFRADRIAQLYGETCVEDELKFQAEQEREEAELEAKENAFAESALTELCDVE